MAQFLFDILSNLPLCGGSERVPSLREVHHVMLCNITASQTKNGVQSVTFVDGHFVRHTVTEVHHDVRRASRNARDSLGLHVSHMVCVMRSRLALGLRASVGRAAQAQP